MSHRQYYSALIASHARPIMEVAEEINASIARMIAIETERFPNDWTEKEKNEAACHSLGIGQ